jgi:peptide/nickel transport system substrate-binding protein
MENIMVMILEMGHFVHIRFYPLAYTQKIPYTKAMKSPLLFLLLFSAALFSCMRNEMTLEEYNALKAEGLQELLAKTQSKPYRGQEYAPGKLGGSWVETIGSDPKSFNYLIAEQDSATSSVIAGMTEYLYDYDSFKKEWKPRIASAEIRVDEEKGWLDVIVTLRDDLYWSYYNSDRKVKVTSDDVIFWYDEICGDPDCMSSGYYQQFVTMEDGTEAHVDITKIDDRRFAFVFPRIVAEPLLATNMDFGPRHIYEPAKQRGGAEAVRKVHSVNTDPRLIPSMGKWFLTKYNPGQRLVYKRNPDYWDKDINGLSIPYYEEMILRIIPEENTKLLLFKNGKTEAYGPRPEDMDELVNRKNPNYAVFNAEGSLGASFWTFNQNPKWEDKPSYAWFANKKFRQAMSCLLNRERIISQVYRGLAEPKLTIFPPTNAYYNPAISNTFLYDPKRAMEMLESAGFTLQEDRLTDKLGNTVEFDLMIRSESSMSNDIALIIMDELSKVGIKLNIRVLDFQNLVAAMFSTYEWDSVIMGFSGANTFPTQGSNVWPSSGNYHVWHPNQESPGTDWEARIDYLYNEGGFTIDKAKAQALWDEFQSILTEQCPLIYLFRSRGFYALNKRWDFANMYYDNLHGDDLNYVFLKQ